MSKSKKKKETKAVIAGQIAFWVSFLGIISLPIPGFWRFVGGFAIASGLKKLIETMATPLDGLHTENGERVKEEPVIQVGTPEDQRAKEVVAGGLDLLSQIAAEREQIDEFVMTRRLKDLDELVRKMLQTVVDDPNEASRTLTAYRAVALSLSAHDAQTPAVLPHDENPRRVVQRDEHDAREPHPRAGHDSASRAEAA